MNFSLMLLYYRIQLVESIPEGLVYPSGSPSFLSTYDAWKFLIKSATTSISIGSFYWTLRSSDVYKHPSSWQGEDIFQDLLVAGVDRKIKIRIAQSEPTQPSPDTQYLEKRKAAEVRSVNFPRLIGGGVLHTKLWIVDGSHIYIGSANMDWRSLTQVKELGALITNCSCLASDVKKIFDMYWELGTNDSVIPLKWPSKYNTDINEDNPTLVNFNDDNNGFLTYFAVN
jgi:phospholipase D3/4